MRLLGKAPGDLLFTGPYGGQLRSDNVLPRIVRPAARALGLPADLRLHDLPAHRGVGVGGGGADLETAASMVGHSSTYMTDTYSHVLQSRRRELAAALDSSGRQARAAAAAGGTVVPLHCPD